MTFAEAAMIMMTGAESVSRDPRVAALENATILGQYDFSNGWSIKVKLCDELNGYRIQYYNNYGRAYSCYKEIVIWSCYYKNGEFMFAYKSGSYYTDIPGDYYITSEGTIYKGFDRSTNFSEVTKFEVRPQDLNNVYPFNVYFRVTLSGKKIEKYYNSDGSVSSQNEAVIGHDFQTESLSSSTNVELWSNLAVVRKDHQTYINDILDFSYN